MNRGCAGNMTWSGKQSEADADVPGVDLYVGQVQSGQPFLKKGIFIEGDFLKNVLYRGKFEVLNIYSSLPSNSWPCCRLINDQYLLVLFVIVLKNITVNAY